MLANEFFGTKSPIAYMRLEGQSLCYEIHGTGRPLLVICGSLGSIDRMFRRLLPVFSARRKVVAVELEALQQLGEDNWVARYEQMADNVAALLDFLNIATTDLFGFSLGGIVALHTAFRHAKYIRKLVVVPPPDPRDSTHLKMLAEVSERLASRMDGSLPLNASCRVTPRPDDIGRLVYRVETPHVPPVDGWNLSLASGFQIPTLLILGGAEEMSLASASKLLEILRLDPAVELLGDGVGLCQLVVLPDSNHVTMLGRVDALAGELQSFLGT